ncbi:type VI secretion system ImpA family N-terminal domain-containing protein [uncultured Tateyamaria sp.]|uniref:type VI secretion system protein TssA n=1 Tax=uncultured Tateyamaria sp. TaxID=455651 RepID=UPI0026205656|nr:type VI secretion system ImpA family N-terminal domain-containing protein [uncultured Tateyamaria sp.]
MELSGFLSTVDSESPSGVDLRNEAAFHAIERQLEPAAREVRKSEREDDPPTAANVGWQDLFDEAATLAKTGRDLRLLVIVVRALSNTNGLGGLVQGLQLITQTLEQYWDSVHPMLRDRDSPRDAALRRTNALKQLENDDNGLLGDLEMNALLQPRGIGIVTGQNMADAARTDFECINEAPQGLSEDDKAKILARHERNQARVIAACRAIATEESEVADALKTDVASALAELARLCEVYTTSGKFEDGTGLIFPELELFLTRTKQVMEANMQATANEHPTTQAAGSATSNGAAPTTPAQQTISSGVNSREDVIASLTQIIEFYNRTEPSSPIPHLAERMRRMVPMNFIELMEEIAPSGIKEFRNVAGVGNGKPK